MPDLTLSVLVSRELLGLSDLELNDHSKFILAPSSPGQITWQRQTASSIFVDDDVTIHRRRSKVTENIVIEVKGSDQGALQANLTEILNAFIQDNYTITTTFDSTEYQWLCEAADYQVIWDGPRVISKQVQVQLQVPRSPVPLQGAF